MLSAYIRGILRRIYWLVPSVFLDPFDFAERWFKVTWEPPEDLFWLLLLLGFFIASVLTYRELWNDRTTMQKQLDDKNKKKEIRETLAQFLREGEDIKSLCYEQNQESPRTQAEEWAQKVAAYLETNLGRDYVISFYNSDGLPTGVTYLSGDHATIEFFLKSRITRLQQYLAELRTL